MAEPQALKIGLTGGIASGKSAVADRFADLGIEVIDTDVLSRDVVAPGQAGLEAIRRAFGDGVIDHDGELDRGKLRSLIFADPERRKQLEALLHPLIRQRMWHQVSSATGHYVILVVPLLIEGGLHREMDRVLVVDVGIDRQRNRLMARDGSNEQEVDAILTAQCSREQRLAQADDVIDNNGSLDDLSEQVIRLHHQYLALPRKG